MPTLVFWQFFNQAYNACVNYSNRNASNSMSDSQVVGGSLALELCFPIDETNQPTNIVLLRGFLGSHRDLMLHHSRDSPDRKAIGSSASSRPLLHQVGVALALLPFPKRKGLTLLRSDCPLHSRWLGGRRQRLSDARK